MALTNVMIAVPTVKSNGFFRKAGHWIQQKMGCSQKEVIECRGKSSLEEIAKMTSEKDSVVVSKPQILSQAEEKEILSKLNSNKTNKTISKFEKEAISIYKDISTKCDNVEKNINGGKYQANSMRRAYLNEKHVTAEILHNHGIEFIHEPNDYNGMLEFIGYRLQGTKYKVPRFCHSAKLDGEIMQVPNSDEILSQYNYIFQHLMGEVSNPNKL